MKILLIKMSSMGDVFHTFPALTDALQQIPNLEVDWIVEKDFAEIPSWHPAVNRVFAIELRRWRKHLWRPSVWKEMKMFFSQFNTTEYDYIVDAQGLIKSAWVVKKLQAKSPKVPAIGLDAQSAREAFAAKSYDRKINVKKTQHAILRLRQLFSRALKYDFDASSVNYGLQLTQWQPHPHFQQDYFVLLHGTTWETKYWPEDHWHGLIHYLTQQGKGVLLPWGTEEEKQRGLRLQQDQSQLVWVPETRLSLNDMARLLHFAQCVISVDTGLSHVAAALNVPLIVLYRVTDPTKVGALGNKVSHFQSPLAQEYIKVFTDENMASTSLQGLEVEKVIKKIQQITETEPKVDGTFNGLVPEPPKPNP